MAEKRITDLAENTSLTGEEVVEIAQLSDTILIAAATISAAASDNSFNDSAAGFLAAGFAINDRVKVGGFANDENNLFVGTVTALTAEKMTIGGIDGDVIIDEAAGADVTIAKWTSRRAAYGGGGGGGGGIPPTVVQHKSAHGNNQSVTLDAAPTPGNLLIAVGSHYSNNSVSGGWFTTLLTGGGSTDGVFILAKVVKPGDDATHSPYAGTTNGSSTTIFEIENWNGALFFPYDAFQEQVAASSVLKLGVPRDGALVVGAFASVQSNTAPTSVIGDGDGVTALPTVIGVSSQASPRQITPFYSENTDKGGVTVTATYPATSRNNAFGCVIMPG